ncbi:MAG TPA: response regulator [Verrucomicrobiae bacterium]|nr:response regulator [Verrucomicrobiae bacterium]
MKKTVRVLVVDDSEAALAAVCAFLEEQEEIEVVGTARNGFELLEKAEKLQPDIVITDLHAPRMSGLEVMLSLRTTMPSTRFIVLTELPKPGDAFPYPPSPADRFLDSKVEPENVLGEIRRLFPEVFGRAPDPSYC